MKALIPLLALSAAACSPEPWQNATVVAEYFGPYTPAAFEQDRAVIMTGHPHAPSARLVTAGVSEPDVAAGRAIVLRCARSGVALSFLSARLPNDLAARKGDVLEVHADAAGRAEVVRVLAGPALPSGEIAWHDALATPRPDRARYVHWRSNRWIVRCRQPDIG